VLWSRHTAPLVQKRNTWDGLYCNLLGAYWDWACALTPKHRALPGLAARSPCAREFDSPGSRLRSAHRRGADAHHAPWRGVRTAALRKGAGQPPRLDRAARDDSLRPAARNRCQTDAASNQRSEGRNRIRTSPRIGSDSADLAFDSCDQILCARCSDSRATSLATRLVQRAQRTDVLIPDSRFRAHSPPTTPSSPITTPPYPTTPHRGGGTHSAPPPREGGQRSSDSPGTGETPIPRSPEHQSRTNPTTTKRNRTPTQEEPTNQPTTEQQTSSTRTPNPENHETTTHQHVNHDHDQSSRPTNPPPDKTHSPHPSKQHAPSAKHHGHHNNHPPEQTPPRHKHRPRTSPSSPRTLPHPNINARPYPSTSKHHATAAPLTPNQQSHITIILKPTYAPINPNTEGTTATANNETMLP